MKTTLKKIIWIVKSVFGYDAILDFLHIRRKPRTIQMPITSRCNSRCVTCNVWKQNSKCDIDPIVLRTSLSNSFYSKVTAVGINGGEFSLVENIDQIFDAVLILPKLKNIYIISNGLLPERILDILQRNKNKCNERGVMLNFTISVDGYNDVHEKVRGIPKCFKRTKLLLDTLQENPKTYADNIMVGCTLSQNNIEYVCETENFLNKYPFKVQYHLAVPNKRIHTFDDYDNYYIINDEHSRMLALEFFYSKFLVSQWNEKFVYFCQYYFLRNKGTGRLSRCPYKFRDITIDEHLNLYLCATASSFVCSSNFISKQKLKEESLNITKYCDCCVHYIYGQPTIKGLFVFLKETFKTKFDGGKKFEILS